jgi:opacity protein-like surface antigen
MRKTSIMLVMALIGGKFAVAQDAQVSQVPSAGSFATEVSLNPFTSNPLSLINGVRGRYFLSNKLAVRADFDLRYRSLTNHAFTPAGTTPVVEQIENNSLFSFNIAPGAEYHFATYNRVSLYAGAAIGLGFTKASAKTTNAGQISGNDIEVKGASSLGRSGFSFGLQAFAGVDVYVYKNLYMGAELGYQYSMFKSSEVERTTSNTTVTDKNHEFESNLRPYILPTFRLGWKF